MKTFFTSEYLGKIFLEVIIIGGLVFFIQLYFENKYKPITAAETLKKENFLNGKRDAYFEAIEIMNRRLTHTQFIINGVKVDTVGMGIGSLLPTDLQINQCFAKLVIYSNNPDIPNGFRDMFSKTLDPILQMSKFVNLIRFDLSELPPIVDTTNDNYKLIHSLEH